MSVLTPDDPSLPARLAVPGAVLVACLCADWCGTCREYAPKLDELSARLPHHVFVWIDIETHPDFTEDDDIENFPTLLLHDGRAIRFYGPMLPHIGHLERLLQSVEETPLDAGVTGPDVRGLLQRA